MKAIYYLFRLMRPFNLLVIALTMGVFHYYLIRQGQSLYDILVVSPLTPKNSFFPHDIVGSFKELFHVDFLLLLLSTLLIGGAGNIINDYFDVKADRINKPEKVIVGKHIKRRWAIVLNWTFNSIAFFISIYLSWKFQNIWLLIIPLVSINLLWFYSMYYKRKFLIGNILIASLTGIIPYYVFQFHGFSGNTVLDLGIESLSFEIIIYSAFAFILNFIREIIKDIADVKGDLRLGSKTLPIVLGIKKVKQIVSVFYFTSTLFLLYIIKVMLDAYFVTMIPDDYYLIAGYPQVITLLAGTILSLIISAIVFLTSNKRKKYLLASNFLKLAMLFGLLSPLFL